MSKSTKTNGMTHLVQRLAKNPRYRGKHVIVIKGKVFVARSAAEAPRLFDRVTHANPHMTPTLLYIPTADALILCLVR